MIERWRIALIDSGIAVDSGRRVVAGRRFVDVDGAVREMEIEPDPSGHGAAIAAIIGAGAVAIDWVVAQVFDARALTTPAAIASAVHWAVSERPHLIHLSLGLRHDRRVLADAVVEAVAASVVVASSPARGDITYPAAYAGVIRATGDARCGPDEISTLDTRQADFGGCAQHHDPTGRSARGASIGAAHVTRFLIRHTAPGESGVALRSRLRELARHLGPERRISARA